MSKLKVKIEQLSQGDYETFMNPNMARIYDHADSKMIQVCHFVISRIDELECRKDDIS